MSKWISVKERLPEASDAQPYEVETMAGKNVLQVVAWVFRRHVRIAKWNQPFGSTHWMRLPAPPEAEGQPQEWKHGPPETMDMLTESAPVGADGAAPPEIGLIDNKDVEELAKMRNEQRGAGREPEGKSK